MDSTLCEREWEKSKREEDGRQREGAKSLKCWQWGCHLAPALDLCLGLVLLLGGRTEAQCVQNSLPPLSLSRCLSLWLTKQQTMETGAKERSRKLRYKQSKGHFANGLTFQQVWGPIRNPHPHPHPQSAATTRRSVPCRVSCSGSCCWSFFDSFAAQAVAEAEEEASEEEEEAAPKTFLQRNVATPHDAQHAWNWNYLHRTRLFLGC